MTLTTILADLYRRFDYTSSPPTATTTRLTAFINQRIRELLAMPGMEHLRQDVTPITAYADQARTGLPPSIAWIYAITDRTNNLKLEQVPLSTLRVTDPAQSFVSGFPSRYAVIGDQAVFRQPATSGLWVVSTSASDNTQKAYVESVVTGGYPNPTITAGTALNGATRVQIGTLATHIEVTRFYIDAVGVGSVSLYDAAAAGNELARIPIGRTFSRCLAVEWFPIQTDDTTEYVDYQREVNDLVNATDEPLVPQDFHPLVIDGAALSELLFIGDLAGAAVARQDWERGKLAIKAFRNNDGDRIASLRYEGHAFSRLGGKYPADSIW